MYCLINQQPYLFPLLYHCAFPARSKFKVQYHNRDCFISQGVDIIGGDINGLSTRIHDESKAKASFMKQDQATRYHLFKFDKMILISNLNTSKVERGLREWEDHAFKLKKQVSKFEPIATFVLTFDRLLVVAFFFCLQFYEISRLEVAEERTLGLAGQISANECMEILKVNLNLVIFYDSICCVVFGYYTYVGDLVA